MANQLKMAEIQAILMLRQRGWSCRRIARELQINRETVARHLALAQQAAKPAKAPIASDPAVTAYEPAGPAPKPTKAPIGSDPAVTAPEPAGPAPTSAKPPLGFETEDPAPTLAKAPIDLGLEDGTLATRFFRREGITLGSTLPGAGPEAPVPAPGPPPPSLLSVASRELTARMPEEGTPGRERDDGTNRRRRAESLHGAEELDEPPSSCAVTQQELATGHSACQPFHEEIIAKLEQGLSAQRIYQDLVAEHEYAGSYYSVRRFVRRLGQQRVLPFRRLETEPGYEAQVDFGTGARVIDPQGKRRRPHVFRIVLSHSRKGYSEVVYHQTTDAFLGCLENAFWHFGGVPQVLVIDNLRAAVTNANWYEPEFNPKIQAFCVHYGVVILPTKVYTPRHKGKIERGVGYVKGNALKGRDFSSLEEENDFLLDWEVTVADTRIHGTTRKQVQKVFEEVEQPRLQPLPLARFPFFHEAERSVHRDGHIEVAKAYYTAPPEYMGRRVWARWDNHLVRIFDKQMKQIAIHVRQEPGKFSTDPQHIASEKISEVERGATWLLRRAKRIGPQTGRWAELVVQARGIPAMRVLMGLLSLAKRYPANAIERACAIAAAYGEVRLRIIRKLIERDAPKQETFAFLTEHPIIRSLSDYGQLVRFSTRKEQST